MKHQGKYRQHFQFLFFLVITGLIILAGCAPERSDETAGIRIPNPETEEEEEEQIAISGVFSVAANSQILTSRVLRQVNGATVKLFDFNGDLLKTGNTGVQGNFSLGVKRTNSNFPWTLQVEWGGTLYRSAIVDLSDAMDGTKSININDITTQITRLFSAKQDQSLENFNRVAQLVMANQFGVNIESRLNIPPEIFMREDMSDPDSLGNLLLNAAAESNLSLINSAPDDESRLASPSFLKAFSEELRNIENPENSLQPIRSIPGSEELIGGLSKMLHAASQAELDTSLNEIRNNTLMNNVKKKEHINGLMEAIDNADKMHPSMRP
ncbi:MAG: hypothetical protein HQM13_21160 [SAR324 cluster bacterium]|nr:hypothetical protein [SAR324 cluster bacterium]